jgi:hypothetical protein
VIVHDVLPRERHHLADKFLVGVRKDGDEIVGRHRCLSVAV